jgi:hypothetical protein
MIPASKERKRATQSMRYFLLLLVFSISRCEAQTAGSSQPITTLDIPSAGVIYLLESGTLKPLPVESFKVGHSSVFKAAYGSKHTNTISLDMPGGRSSFRIATDKPEFVFTFATPENATIYVSEENKNARRFATETLNVRDNSIANIPGLPIDITQLGPSSFKLVPKSPLHPGEYTITLKAAAPAPNAKGRRPFQYFTFGID